MNWLFINKFNKQEIITIMIVIAIIIFSIIYYFGYIKLPEFLSTPKEKTQQELLNNFKADLAMGKLITANGTIAQINGNEITLATVVGDQKKEEKITLTKDTVIRRLTMPELKPNSGLTPMIETLIGVQDLRTDDKILANRNKDGAVVMIDVMPNQATTVNGSAATTTVK